MKQAVRFPELSCCECEEPDVQHVHELCKATDSAHSFPQNVAAYIQDSHCLPFVLHRGARIIGFCNMRIVDNRGLNHKLLFLERIRISPTAQGNGLGAFLLQSAQNAVKERLGVCVHVRFLSATTPHNSRMICVFDKAGWTRAFISHVWPSCEAIAMLLGDTDQTAGRFLDALGIASLVPPKARAAVSAWREVSQPQELVALTVRLRDCWGSSHPPVYRIQDTPEGAALFLDPETARKDKQAAWLLERARKPPVVMVLRRHRAGPADTHPGNLLTACAGDREGAEFCVAFSAAQSFYDSFQLEFDSAISADVSKKSRLLSSLHHGRLFKPFCDMLRRCGP